MPGVYPLAAALLRRTFHRVCLQAVMIGFAGPLLAQNATSGDVLAAGTVLKLHNEQRACTHTHAVGETLRMRLTEGAGALVTESAISMRVIFAADSSGPSDSLRLVVIPLSIAYRDSLMSVSAKIREATWLRLRLGPVKKKKQSALPGDPAPTLVSAVQAALRKADERVVLCLEEGPVSIELVEPLALRGY